MLGCDRDQLYLAYETLPKQYQAKHDIGVNTDEGTSFENEEKSLLNNFRWLSEFCVKSIPTRAVLLTNLDGFNHKEQFLVILICFGNVNILIRTSLDG